MSLGLLTGRPAAVAAMLALVALAFAVSLGWYELWARRRQPRVPLAAREVAPPRAVRLGPVLCAPAAAALAAQSWFTRGTVIAAGDQVPPQGSAWIAHLFAPWVWTGSNLGAPGTLEQQAPWAALLEAGHALGGSAALAQRLWLTALFAGAALASVLLLRMLGLGAVPSAIGGLVYVFNPFVLANVGASGVYLAALVLLAALPALVLAVASGRMRLRSGLVLFALAAPLVGYVYLNPPLAGMVVMTTLLAVPASWLLGGGLAGKQGARFTLLGLITLVAAGAYWIVPSALALGGVATGNLTPVAAWAWSESRATLANAFWLNTTWIWRYSYYLTFTGAYATQPLAFARMLLPATAFSALILVSPAGQHSSTRLLRIAVPAASLALFLVFFSTGTRFPAGPIFRLVYHLPFGWLLREPGRFLMAAALAYAVLIGTAAAAIADGRRLAGMRPARRPDRRMLLIRGASLACLVLVVAPAYPLATGELVPGKRTYTGFGATFPSAHVRFPAYWSAMASYLNRGSPAGAVLLLPPNDSTYMPFRWYYGADTFETDLIRRHVVNTSPASYFSVNGALARASELVAQSLLARRWREASLAAGAIGTSLVLVRGDISADFAGRTILSPAALASALAHDPLARLLRRDGPLGLYSLSAAALPPVARLVTTTSSSPDLRALSVLPPGTAIVTSVPRAGETALVQPPPLSQWQVHGRTLTTTLTALGGRRNTVVYLAGGVGHAPPGVTVQAVPAHAGSFRVSLQTGANAVPNGDFATGVWGPVGDCNDLLGAKASGLLDASVLSHAGPGGAPALRLAARVDGACEAEAVSLPAGPALVSLWVRHLAGAPPQLCLWEYAARQCAQNLPALMSGPGWQHYQAVLSFPASARQSSVFLYSYSNFPGQHTVNEYASVSIRALPTANRPVVLLANSPGGSTVAAPGVEVAASAWSQRWTGPPGARHVLVDGMRNGWIVDRGAVVSRPRYSAAASVHAALIVSLTMAGLAALFAVSLLPQVTRRKRRFTGKHYRQKVTIRRLF
ncbi:MAG: hypothetical protein ACYCO3_10530 [Mycobacteriales bacterium]